MNSNLNNINCNFDKKEIKKFQELSKFWWDLEGEFKFLHYINSLRLNYISYHSNGLFDKNVLDVGCGGGILSESMAREGSKVTGLDIGYEQLKIARFHAIKSGLNINYLQETIESHAEKYSNVYDVITCMEILEHVPNPYSVVNTCSKLIKPNGKVFFSTINRNFKSWFFAIICAEYVLKLIPKGTHNFKKFIKPTELLSWTDRSSLKEEDIVGISYNPLINNFKFSSNISINYILCVKST